MTTVIDSKIYDTNINFGWGKPTQINCRKSWLSLTRSYIRYESGVYQTVAPETSGIWVIIVKNIVQISILLKETILYKSTLVLVHLN